MYFILMRAISLMSSLKLILYLRGAFRKYSIIFRQNPSGGQNPSVVSCDECKPTYNIWIWNRVDATIPAYEWKFCAGRPCHFPAVTSRVETYNARSLDFRFHAGSVASRPTQRILPAQNQFLREKNKVRQFLNATHIKHRPNFLIQYCPYLQQIYYHLFS